MLLVDNGTFKSGSSWLAKLICHLKKFERPADRFLSKIWKNPHIPANRLRAFLRDCPIHDTDYFVKAHYHKKSTRDTLLAHPDVRVALITRDLRDVVVSAYFHYRRVRGSTESFDDYFWTRGRRVAHKVLRYNETWNIESPRIFRTTYEQLKADSRGELLRLAPFLGVPADDALIDRVIAETTFDKMKALDRTGHIRSGKTGGFREHMDAAMIEEMQRIESRPGLPLLTNAGLLAREKLFRRSL